MSRIKEPHYFNTDMKYRNVLRRSEYVSLFPVTAQTRVLAEASTWYLYSDVAVPNILNEHPDAKIIAMTRNPFDMAVSLFYHNRYKLHEPLEEIGAAWAAQNRRASGIDLPRDCVEPAFLQYHSACSLRFLIDRLQSRVAPENLLVLRLEDMRVDPRNGYKAILDFVGVVDDGRTDFPVRNEARQQRSRLVSRIIRQAVKVKRKFRIRTPSGLSSINSTPLVRGEIPQSVRDEISASLADQHVTSEQIRRAGLSVT